MEPSATSSVLSARGVGCTALVLLMCWLGAMVGLAAAAQLGAQLHSGGDDRGQGQRSGDTRPRQLAQASAASADAAVAFAAALASAAATVSAAGATPQVAVAVPDTGSAGTSIAKPAVLGSASQDPPPVVVVPPLERYVYDIALSTGYRPLYGATFASCLVGLMASGAVRHAAAVHVLLSDARLLNFSVVHNLAHMGSNVRASLYDMEGASNSMRARNTFYQLLRVPDLAPGSGSAAATAAAAAASAILRDRQVPVPSATGGPGGVDSGGARGRDVSDLPAVFLEDDVWLVDDFPRKMHRVAAHAAKRTSGRPYIIKLYLHSGKYGAPDAVRALHAETCNVSATVFPSSGSSAGTPKAGAVEGGPGAVLVTAFPPPSASSSSGSNSSLLEGYRAKPRMYKWGAQGLYFSDGATRRRLADCYLTYTAKSFERQRRFKDWPLKKCILALNVSTFDSGRSLVQHIGAASSLFGDAASNSRYHRACNFPFLERLPSEDAPRDWF